MKGDRWRPGPIISTVETCDLSIARYSQTSTLCLSYSAFSNRVTLQEFALPRPPLRSPRSYNSPLITISHLLLLSSIAFLFFGPHRSCTLVSIACIRSRCSLDDWTACTTNLGLQLNFFATVQTDHFTGSSVRSLRISAISAAETICFGGKAPGIWASLGISGGKLGVEGDWEAAVEEALRYFIVVEDSKSLGRFARRLGSFGGRNLKGVWKTEASEEGGLKMMWSCACAGARKDGCGAIFSSFLVRDLVATERCWVLCNGDRRTWGILRQQPVVLVECVRINDRGKCLTSIFARDCASIKECDPAFGGAARRWLVWPPVMTGLMQEPAFKFQIRESPLFFASSSY
jgi:hypothetical protein